jgi:hypothetical protein
LLVILLFYLIDLSCDAHNMQLLSGKRKGNQRNTYKKEMAFHVEGFGQK